MAQKIDTLYYDLELRNATFQVQVKEAQAQLTTATRTMGTALPNAATAASVAIRDGFDAATQAGKAADAATRALAEAQRVVEAASRAAAAQLTAMRTAAAASATGVDALGAGGASAVAGVATEVGLLGSAISGGLSIAIGLATHALIEHFLTAREEAKRTREAFQEEIEKLTTSGSVSGLDKLALEKFQGSFNATTGQFEGGLKQAIATFTTIDAEYQAAVSTAGAVFAGGLRKKRDEAKKVLDDLQKQMEAIQAALRAVPEGRAPTQPITITGARDKTTPYTAEDAKRDARTTREATEALGDLIARAAEGRASVLDFDRSLRDITERFASAKRVTTDQAAAFTTLRTQAAAARTAVGQHADALKRIEQSKAAAELARIQAQLAPTYALQLKTAIAELNERLLQLKVPEETRVALLAVQKATLDAAHALEQTQTSVASILESQVSPMQKLVALNRRDAELESQLIGLQREGAIGDAKRVGIEKERQAVHEAIDKVVQSQEGHLSGVTQKSTTLVAVLSEASQVAYGLASAFLGANDTLTKMVSSIGHALEGMTSLTAAAKAAGGLSKLFSTSAGVASALPGIGAIVGGGIGLFSLLAPKSGGGETPEQRAQRELLKQNNDRLAELRDRLGDYVRLTLSSAKVAAIRGVPVTEQRTVATQFGTFQSTELRNAADILADLRKVGVTLSDLRKAAADLHVSLSEHPTAQELQQLAEAIRITSAAVQEFTERRDVISTKLEFGALTPQQAAADAVDAFKKAFGQAFEGLDLSGLDFSSLDGLKESIKGLVETFGADGVLSDAEQAVLDALRDILAKWEAATPKARTIAEQFADAMDVLAVSFEFHGTEAADRLDQIKAKFATLFPELAASIDFSSVKSFDDSIQKIIDGFTADGVLTDAEKEQIAILRTLSEAFHASADAASEAAQKAREELLAKRQGIVRRGEERIQLDNVTDPVAQLQIRLGALTKAFPELAQVLGDVDVSTEEGRNKLHDLIKNLILGDNGQLETLAKAMGISVDELTSSLLGLDSGIDATVQHVKTAGEVLRDALSTLNENLDIQGITDPLERAKALFAEISKLSPDIADAIKGFDLSTEEGRQAALKALIPLALSATDPALKADIKALIDALRAVPSAAAGAPGIPGLTDSQQSQIDKAIQSISVSQIGYNPQFAHLLDLETKQLGFLAIIAAATTAFVGVSPPALPRGFGGPSFLPSTSSASSSGGGPAVNHFYASVNFMGPVGGDVNAVAAAAHDGMKKAIDNALGRDASFKRQLMGRSELA